MSTVTIDRHVLASSASSINLAWRSFGWTPAIAGARATRLEEEVPWGTLSDRSAHPGWLTGASSAIAEPSNMDRLQWAFLPMDGRMGLSVWGAAGDPRAAPGSRRVITHTLLFDETAFVRLAGYPFGLFGTASQPAGWLRCFESTASFAEPTGLEALRLELSPALTRAFETARIAEVGRLRAALLTHTDGDEYALAYRVARIHEALARARAGDARPPLERVALRDDGQGAPLLVRLAWLALPLADRVGTWFSTEQARTERPRAHLMVLPRMEWGRSTPPATRIVNPDDADEEGEPSPGRARWAAGVTGPESSRAPSQVLRRADARGWSVLGPDDTGAGVGVEVARLLKTWRDDGPSLNVASELMNIERGRTRPRAGGVGAYLAHAVWNSGSDDAESAQTLVEFCLSSAEHGAGFLRGVVRTLQRLDGAAAAALSRCLACVDGSEEGVLADLGRLGGPERKALEALLDRADGLTILLQALNTVSRAGLVLPEPEAGRIRARLRQPSMVARALGAEPAELSTLLDVLDDAGTTGGSETVQALAYGVDAFRGQALAPGTVDRTVEAIRSNEAGGDLIRIWHDSAGHESARLQILTHPDWRTVPDQGEAAYRAAARTLASAPADRVGSQRADWIDGLLMPWLTVVERGERLDGFEGVPVAELIWRRAAWEGTNEGGGEAAPSGQRSGGEVWGSPAVSPLPALDTMVHALSTDALQVLLRHLAEESPTWATGMLTMLLTSPAISALHEATDLDLLLRQLWAEWTPESGVPSLRGAVIHQGPSLVPLLDRLHKAPAPIPLGAVLRAFRMQCDPPSPALRPEGPRSLFLRPGGVR